MTKMPPMLSPYYHHRKIQRLIFPKHGDSNIFSKCGRKHFAEKHNYTTPYASIPPQLQLSPQQLYHNYKRPQPSRQSHPNQSLSNTKDLNQGKERNLLENRQRYDRPNHHVREALEQQVYSFTIEKTAKTPKNYQLSQPVSQSSHNEAIGQIKWDQNRYSELAGSRQRRLRTQVQDGLQGQLDGKGPNKRRTRTESTEPGIIKSYLREPRFNPTYLSSINY